jgi:hypothetical protein
VSSLHDGTTDHAPQLSDEDDGFAEVMNQLDNETLHACDLEYLPDSTELLTARHTELIHTILADPTVLRFNCLAEGVAVRTLLQAAIVGCRPEAPDMTIPVSEHATRSRIME